MPYKDPHCQAAIESNRKRAKKYNSSEKGKKRNREYLQRDYVKEFHSNYGKTNEQHYYNRTIHNWKRIGIKSEDYHDLFILYYALDYCMLCNKTIEKRINKHLDHCHKTGKVRYVLCRSCNFKMK